MTDSWVKYDEGGGCGLIGSTDIQQQHEIMAEIERRQQQQQRQQQQRVHSRAVHSTTVTEKSSPEYNLDDEAFLNEQRAIMEEIERQQQREREERARQQRMNNPARQSHRSRTAGVRCSLSDLEAKAAALHLGRVTTNEGCTTREDHKNYRGKEASIEKSSLDSSASSRGSDGGEVQYSGQQRIRIFDKRSDVARSIQKKCAHCSVCNQRFFVSQNCEVLYCPDCKVLTPTGLGTEVGAWHES
eukprot:CAMPEP_0197446546 /NCGR_PEP_ID=MMETSP1175-20131217/11477_1 /TAXON_ID=1003142 /ORGANISM="Triceratium dubium, Strain CCMP147" /LENGTH=242 /DNA_ID=CAMNT_0042977689 /DNA_START=111 /DNA_END=839 /DNA_ORIENTATION=-